MSSRRSAATLLGLLALFAVCAAPARANLLGDVISIDHYYPNLSSSGLYEAHTTLVTAGTGDSTNMIGAYVVNPEAGSINVHFTFGASSWSVQPFNGLVIGGIDDALLSVTADTNLAGWDVSRLSYDAHTIYSNWSGLAFDNSSYFRLHLVQAAPVPETPSTLTLIGLSVAALLVLHRRRRAA
jgi:MYXO-CTERM domain-containing protein